MKGYAVVTIEVLFQALGEERFNSLLSDFSCPNNQDVLAFFQLHALQASRVGFSQTHVVLAGYQGKPVIAGYYTLTQKALVIKERANLSKSLNKRLNAFARTNKELGQKEIIAPLIAQLGKNATYQQAKLISGDDLLELAIDEVRKMLRIAGGRAVYLECEDNAFLIDFYKRNGFQVFGERALDADERHLIPGVRLLQMIRVFRSSDLNLSGLSITLEELMAQ